jgi:4'-phosphopantetheinyl transferase
MMVFVYYMDIRSLEPEDARFAAALGSRGQEKMYQYRNRDDRLRCLAGGLLTERILKGREIRFTKRGKPFIPEGPHFNLSHSGNFTCMAVSPDSPVGIDIEFLRDEDFPALARIAFHPEERNFFLQKPDAERFFMIWTLKESYIKMLGLGFSLEPRSFSILSLSGSEPVSYQNLHAINGYSLSLCTARQTAEPVQIIVEDAFENKLVIVNPSQSQNIPIPGN